MADDLCRFVVIAYDLQQLGIYFPVVSCGITYSNILSIDVDELKKYFKEYRRLKLKEQSTSCCRPTKFVNYD